MSKVTRRLIILVKIAGSFLAIVLLAWLGTAAYVSTHKKELLETITSLINDNIKGTVTIESMDPALIRGFPGISVKLNTVTLRDSLWHQHRRDLLNAREVYVAVNAFSLLSGKPRIQDLSVENGRIYLFTDSMGYRNSGLFTRNNNPRGNRVNEITLKNVDLHYENKSKRKYFNFIIRHLNSRTKYGNDNWRSRITLDVKVKNLMFNTVKGSYLKNKTLTANWKVSYSHDNHELNIPAQNLKIDNDIFLVDGRFAIGPAAPDYTLNIKASSVPFRHAAALLTPKAKNTLGQFNLQKPIGIEATINGRFQEGYIPLVQVRWTVHNNVFTVRNETIEDCSFGGRFTNEVVPGRVRRDPNSSVRFYQMKGKWKKIAFAADTITVSNLEVPVLEGKFRSSFPLTRVNAISAGETFQFNKGTARLDLLYRAPVDADARSTRFIRGTVTLDDTDLMYKPRNIRFTDVSASLVFKGADLFLRNMNVRSGSSSLKMEGSLRNFLNLYYTAPQEILLDWHITSPHIDLAEFLGFLGRRRVTRSASSGSNGTIARMFVQLDRVLNEAGVHMNLNVDKLTHKRFTAANITSDITLTQSGISLNDISLNHAGGKVHATGTIDQSGSRNRFRFNSRVRNVDIRKLFYAFGNFGQDGISYENLKGEFFSTIGVSGSLKENGDIIPRSFYGTVSFDLRDGALIKFEPMEKIGNFAFPNRNFSNITFANLRNTLDIRGDKIIIRPMLIRSSVLNVFVEGTYGLSSGTDIALRVPLRNPAKDKDRSAEEKEERITKGIILNLRAAEDESGKVRITLGKGSR